MKASSTNSITSRKPIHDSKKSKTKSYEKNYNRQNHVNKSNSKEISSCTDNSSAEEHSIEENQDDLHFNRSASLQPQIPQHSEKYTLESENIIPKNSSSKSFTFIILAVLIVCVAWIYVPKKETPIQNNHMNGKKSCSFAKLKESFINQEESLWMDLEIGIEGILNKDPTVPGVYLFLHENNMKTQELVKYIVDTSSKCFDSNDGPVQLKLTDFTENEIGTAIKKYKIIAKDGGAVLVANLNEIPGKNAEVLHSICDIHNPIVRRVVIFLTLSINATDIGNPIEIAETKLTDLWGETVDPNNLAPLITRITDVVVRLNNE